jgi:hypothetical protein
MKLALAYMMFKGLMTTSIALLGALLHGAELEFVKKSMGARHRVGIGLSYRSARLHRLAEFIPRSRFMGSINV